MAGLKLTVLLVEKREFTLIGLLVECYQTLTSEVVWRIVDISHGGH